MRKNNFPKIIFTSLILSGCVNTLDTTDLEVVPSNETLMALEADNIQNIQEKKTARMVLTVQPLNKKELCTLPYLTFEGDSLAKNGEFFWDGKCVNGKADGLGRLFIKTESGEKEQLIEFTDNQKLMNVYWIYDRKNKKIYSGHAEVDLDEKTQFGYFRTVESTKSDLIFTDFLETRDVTYVYRYSQDSSFEEYTKAYCALENNQRKCFNISTLLKPDLEKISFTTSLDNEKPKAIGYVSESNPLNPEKKAVKLITEKGNVTTQNVEFPLEYLTYIKETNNEIKNRVSFVPQAVTLSESKIADYTGKACSVTAVDFMPLEEYLKICE
ncbi:hypothetical protein [Succinivibrio sp.]|jgi:hypothetical protein|uniref:hypothetical protein n=1 Tax=Succinivibrio sp. TaxID=2053619 RepID=UPI0038684642